MRWSYRRYVSTYCLEGLEWKPQGGITGLFSAPFVRALCLLRRRSSVFALCYPTHPVGTSPSASVHPWSPQSQHFSASPNYAPKLRSP